MLTCRGADQAGRLPPGVDRPNGDAAFAALVFSARARAFSRVASGYFLPPNRVAISGIEPLALYEALWSSEISGRDELPVDPVCRMAVEPSAESGRLTVAGREFHFCSLECAQAFSSDPDRYTAR